MEKAQNFIGQHKKITIGISAIMLLLTGAGAVYGIEAYQYSQTQQAKDVKKLEEAKKEITDTITIASNQITLPKDEEPVLATVSDRQKLLNQKFFEKSQNGDQLLMYPKNKKVYIYRPSTKKVIASSILAFGDPTPTAQPTPIGGTVAGDSTTSGKILIQTEQ